MTKNEMELDPEGENSLLSNESNLTSEFLIGETIIKEEERLVVENEKVVAEEESKFPFRNEEKENEETEEDEVRKREAEIKEKRYKRLIHLLKNSKMYAVILKNRMKQEHASRRRRPNNNTKPSEESNVKRQKSLRKYAVGEVLTEKQIDENIVNDEEFENCEIDYFSSTYVTNLGFTVSFKQPHLLEGGALKDYQLRGLDWMINLFLNGVNGILADEMGLGKTVQVISFICYLIEQNIQGPFLIVAPLSTLTNWMSEFKRFAPKVPILLYHGTEPVRRAMLPKIGQLTAVGDKKAHKVVITSFQIPMMDRNILKRINWYYLIIDEGHRIKNYNSLLSRTLKEFNTIGRLLLTGTPLQNNLTELWSLLNFLLPEVFSSLDVFESWFDVRELEENGTKFVEEKFNVDIVNILQEILTPFLLRRVKKDVNLQLPPKKEILIYCRLTARQKELYEATLDRSIEYLLKPREDVFDINEPLPKRRCFLNSPYGRKIGANGSTESGPPINKREPSTALDENYDTNIVLRNPQMQLRKIVNHPYLVQYPLVYGTEEFRIDEDLVKESGKLLVLDALLAKLKKRGHRARGIHSGAKNPQHGSYLSKIVQGVDKVNKPSGFSCWYLSVDQVNYQQVVLFSYFKFVLDIIADYANMRGYSYCRLDGSVNINDRNDEISKFYADPNIYLFLVTIRAGGLGINLTAADTVIFFDSDWNPQMNLQSQDRCHRIGQTKPVVVYKLCSIGTIDERIIERGNAKRRLEKMILQKGKFTHNSNSSTKLSLMDLQELKKLLKSTDNDTVINSNGYVLTDEELEALLDRSDMYGSSAPADANGNKVFKVLNYEK